MSSDRSDSGDSVRAVVVTARGGPEVLEVQERPRPEPAGGEVLVGVEAAGVNFIDVYKREGIYPVPPPFVLGEEFAGTVLAVGDGVTGLEVGQAVATAAARQGAFATATIVPAGNLVAVPDGVATDVA